MREVRRRDGDHVLGLAAEVGLTGKDGDRIQSVGGRRGDPRLPPESPKLRSRGDRIGGYHQMVKTAAEIERVIEASSAADGVDAEEFPTQLVMRDIGNHDNRAGSKDCP